MVFGDVVIERLAWEGPSVMLFATLCLLGSGRLKEESRIRWAGIHGYL